jgi:hypothetical protein
MTQEQYQLWLAAWNAGLKAGLSPAQALANADKLVATMKD